MYSLIFDLSSGSLSTQLWLACSSLSCHLGPHLPYVVFLLHCLFSWFLSIYYMDFWINLIYFANQTSWLYSSHIFENFEVLYIFIISAILFSLSFSLLRNVWVIGVRIPGSVHLCFIGLHLNFYNLAVFICTVLCWKYSRLIFHLSFSFLLSLSDSDFLFLSTFVFWVNCSFDSFRS